MSHKNIKLDFIGIGARKSGTTWLSKCLSEHPDIDFAKNKETNYFLSKEFLKKMSMDPVLGDPVRFIKVKNQAGLEKEFRNTSRKIKGEYSPYYLYDPNAAKRIKQDYPNVKLIVALRDPVESIYSNYWFDKSSGQSNFPETFESALEKYPHYIDWMLYYKHLKPYTELFSREKIHIILMDEIRENPERVLEELFDFLEVDKEFKPPSLFVFSNKTKQVKSVKFAVFGRFIARVLLALKLRVLIDKLFMVYRNVNKSDFKYDPMKESTKKLLKKYFLSDIEILEILINKDLSGWK